MVVIMKQGASQNDIRKLVALFEAKNLKVGISSQAPQKGVCVSEFSELSKSTDNVSDFRMGE